MKKLFITLLGICSCFTALLCACDTEDAQSNIVGDSFAKIYGIKMGIEYDGTTVNATDGVYHLNTGSTYIMYISLVQGGGSSPAAIRGDCITFECSGSVNIAYAGGDTEEGETVYSMYCNSAETSIVAAYYSTYSCSAEIVWEAL